MDFYVSIVIVCYNEGELLLRAVKSVKNQTYKDFDFLIVNDFSKNPETNKCCTLLEKEGIKIIWRKTNGGLSAARNTGFEQAKGEIIIPLDADDTLPVDAVSKIVDAFKVNPEAEFVFGNYLKKYEDGLNEEVNIQEFVKENSFDISKVLQNWKLLGTAPCKKRLWKRMHGFSLVFSNTLQDMDFWMKVFHAGTKGCIVNSNIYHWYQYKNSMSGLIQPSELHFLKLKHINLFSNNGETKSHLAKNAFNIFYAENNDKYLKFILRNLPFKIGGKRLFMGLLFFVGLKNENFLQIRKKSKIVS